MKDLNLDFVRVTEAAAIAASAWVGSGDKASADRAATDAMRDRLNGLDFSGVIAIGEGIKDKSHGLFFGERIGRRCSFSNAKCYELAVDPIDGTRPTANSGPEAISVLSVAEKDALFKTPEFYMNKLAYGPELAKRVKLSLEDPVEETVRRAAEASGREPSQLVVCVLDRPRHEKLIGRLRASGVRIKLIQDCDISGAIATCLPDSGIDLLYGIGGAPEGVITACAMKCLRGGFEAQVVRGDGSFDKTLLGIEDLVKGDCAFSATGVTTGSLLKGVRYTDRGPVTHSVFMRSSSGTIRWLTVYHGN
jgi:fructose-1,6-bisphosphatase II